MTSALQARLDRFRASETILRVEYERAKRWRNHAAAHGAELALATAEGRMKGFSVAIALLDACVIAEQGLSPARDADRNVVARLREIAIARELFEGDRKSPAEPVSDPAIAAELAAVAADPVVEEILETFPGAEIVDVRRDQHVREALRTAISHLEHMAVWITQQNAGYSFEALGEDMPGLRAALT
jgi:hypothetical protein